MTSIDTNLIKRIEPSAAPAPSPEYIHNAGLEYAEANNRDKRQLAPDNGSIFKPVGANIITFRPPTSEVVDYSEAYMEFTLTIANPSEWAPPECVEQLFRLVTLEWGSDQVIELQNFGVKRAMDRMYEATSQTIVDNSTLMGQGMLTYAQRAAGSGQKFRLYFSSVPFITKNPLFLNLVPNLHFELKFHLQEPTECLDNYVKPATLSADYTIENVLFHWERITPPIAIIDEIKAAIDGPGLHWCYEDWQRFEEQFSTNTYERNLAVSYSSIKGVLFTMTEKGVNDPPFPWTEVAGKPFVRQLRDSAVQSIQLQVDGKLVPQIALDTPYKRWKEAARYYRVFGSDGEQLKLNGYWGVPGYHEDNLGSTPSMDDLVLALKAGSRGGAYIWAYDPVYYIDLETNREGLISGLNNQGQNSSINLIVKLKSAPSTPITLTAYVLHDSIATLTKNRAYLTK